MRIIILAITAAALSGCGAIRLKVNGEDLQTGAASQVEGSGPEYGDQDPPAVKEAARRHAAEQEAERARQAAAQQPVAPIQVAHLAALLDAGSWATAREYVSATGNVRDSMGATRNRRLDNGEQRTWTELDTCVQMIQEATETQRKCDAMAADEELRARCLTEVPITRNGKPIERFSDEYCGFSYERYERMAAEARRLAAELLAKVEARQAEDRERETRRRRLEDEATETAAYRRAELAAELCRLEEGLAEVRAAERDGGSAARRRQLASTREDMQAVIRKLRREHRELKGTPPKKWCEEPAPVEVVREYVEAAQR